MPRRHPRCPTGRHEAPRGDVVDASATSRWPTRARRPRLARRGRRCRWTCCARRRPGTARSRGPATRRRAAAVAHERSLRRELRAAHGADAGPVRRDRHGAVAAAAAVVAVGVVLEGLHALGRVAGGLAVARERLRRAEHGPAGAVVGLLVRFGREAAVVVDELRLAREGRLPERAGDGRHGGRVLSAARGGADDVAAEHCAAVGATTTDRDASGA